MKNKHAQQLGKLGGQVKSEAKTKAVRENGKKGGRPKNPNRILAINPKLHPDCICIQLESGAFQVLSSCPIHQAMVR